MVVFENWKHWVDLYAGLFSRKKIVLTLGPMYGEGKRIGHFTDQFTQYAVDKYSIDFKKPFNLLAKLPDKARAEGETANSIWWR